MVKRIANKPGRPAGSKIYDRSITVSLKKNIYEAIKRLASNQGKPMSAIVRELFEMGFAKKD
jgi:predicted DNA-binding protein